MAKCVKCGAPGLPEKAGHPGVHCGMCFGDGMHGTGELANDAFVDIRPLHELEDGEHREAGPYVSIGASIGELVAEKQKAYGDSFGKSGAVMRILYPDGISLEQLDDGLTVIRVLDKLFRIATDRDALGESPWRDIAGYAVLSVKRLEDKKETEVTGEQ